jgi:diguanylate cyclase (GGDEF)-like protein
LQVVAQTLENSLRPTDFVGRWAEDEFLAILPGCRVGGLPVACERIRRMLDSSAITWWGTELPVAGVSLGPALAETGDNPEALMVRARRAMPGHGEGKAASAGIGGGLEPRD